jgi:O-antigen/teichoic acid export membrane protein
MSSLPTLNSLSGRLKGLISTQHSRDVLITAGSNLSITVISALGGILTARMLEPTGRGELATAIVWAALLTTLATLGLPQALIYFSAQTPESRKDLFVAAMTLLVFQSTVVCVVGYLLVHLLLDASHGTVSLVVSLYLGSIPMSLGTTYLATIAQGAQKFRLSNGIRLCSAIAYIAAIFMAYALKATSSIALVSLLLVTQSIVTTGSFVAYAVALPINPLLSVPMVRGLLRYGLKSYAGSLSWMTNARVDQFIMSLLLASRDIGLYAVAVSYATLLFPLAGAIANTLFPHVARLSGHKASQAIINALKINLLISSSIAAVMIMSASALIPLVFGADFNLSVLPAIILVPGTVILGCNYILSDGLRGRGFPGRVSIAEIVGLICTLISLGLLLPRIGTLGAAISSLICYSVVFAILLTMVSTLPANKSTQ